jgi:glycerol-3-phosphate acyltransferase PlsY
MITSKLLSLIILSYLFGSIPFSQIAAWHKKKSDLSQSGTKNIGATNAFLVGGPTAGIFAYLGDIGKGILAVYLARLYIGTDTATVLAGFFSILGHDYSIFLKFSGGKGIAPTGGVLLGIDFRFGLLVFSLWILTILLIRYFVISTLIILCLIPWLIILFNMPLEYLYFAFATAGLGFWQHRLHIRRLFKGFEPNIFDDLSRLKEKS